MSRMTKPFMAAIAVLFLASQVLQAQSFTGDGGRGVSLAVLVPSAQGIAANQNYLPTMVQGVLVGDLTKHSAISVLDRLQLETVLKETESGIYKSESDFGQLGNIANVDYALTGRISKTGAGYAMQLQVVGTGKTNIGVTKAAYTGSCTIAELDNFTGIRKASLELLTQMGVTLTDATRRELSGAADANQVNAQTALARGIVAQQLGNTAETLAQYYQAVAYDPSLAEAATRANTMSASVRTGSLGQNIRNDIAWRAEWVKILADAQKSLNNIPSPPRPPALPQNVVVAYIIVPEPDFSEEEINYNTRTVKLITDFNINENLFSAFYPAEYLTALDAYYAAFAARGDVYNEIVADLNAGLNATERNDAWKLTELKAIERNAPAIIPRTETAEIKGLVELLNDAGKVIGSSGNASSFGRVFFRERNTELYNGYRGQISFTVKADDITDHMALRVNASATPARGNLVQVMSSEEMQARPDLQLGRRAIFFGEMRINGGTFQMGSNSGDNYDKPVHTVTITGFYMGEFEVTQREWTAVMGSNPSVFKGDFLPVECVTWFDAIEYCNKRSEMESLTPAYTITERRPATGYPITDATVTWNRNANGYRLPTEAEWEYAARGGNGSPGNYTYSGSNNPDEVAWYDGNSGRKTQNVGTKKPNGLGLYDMSGNVWELCWDWHGTYPSGAQTDPQGASWGDYRVIRGGGWHISAVRSANRAVSYPNNQRYSIGFRLARNGN